MTATKPRSNKPAATTCQKKGFRIPTLMNTIRVNPNFSVNTREVQIVEWLPSVQDVCVQHSPSEVQNIKDLTLINKFINQFNKDLQVTIANLHLKAKSFRPY